MDGGKFGQKELNNGMNPPPYPPEIKAQILELVRFGRTLHQLAQEFEPTAKTIRSWPFPQR